MACNASLRSAILSSCFKLFQGFDYSGHRFDWMIDLREGLFQPWLLQEIATLLWPLVQPYNPHRIGGPTMSGDQLAMGLLFEAMRAGYRMEGFSLRRTPKEYGLRKWIEGPAIRPGERIVIVDDLLSSGSTLTRVAGAIRSAQGEVVAAAVVIDFERGGAQELQKLGVPVIALTTLSELGVTARASSSPAVNKLWQFAPLNVGSYTAPHCSPVLDCGRIVVGADLGFVVSLSIEGDELWRVTTAEHVLGVRGQVVPSVDGYTFGAHDGILYYTNRAGALVWKTKLGDWISVPPAYDQTRNVLYTTVNMKDEYSELVAIDARVGIPLWRFGMHSFVHSWPALVNSNSSLLVGFNNGRFVCLDCVTGHVQWHHNLGTAIKGRLACTQTCCCFGAFDGNAYGLSIESGKEVWRRKLGDWLLCLPATTEEDVFFGAQSHVFRLRAEDGRIVWVQATGRVCGVAVSKDESLCVCGSESGTLYGLDAGTGRELWRYIAGHPIRTIPLIEERRCIFPAGNGLLHCIEMPHTPVTVRKAVPRPWPPRLGS